MVVLRREQSVNWPGFYIDVAGTSPAEAGIGSVEDGHPGARQLFGGASLSTLCEQGTVHIRFLGAVSLLAASPGL